MTAELFKRKSSKLHLNKSRMQEREEPSFMPAKVRQIGIDRIKSNYNLKKTPGTYQHKELRIEGV